MSGAEKSMTESRPMASLTANLLARRGAARPAMRRPSLAGMGQQAPISDDLGWNDMGQEIAEAGFEPAPMPMPMPVVTEGPAMIEALDAISDRIRQTVLEKPARTRKARPATLSGAKHKAAFTLRLDAPRHLRLRLLSAVSRRSAQQLLVEALDEVLAEQEQVRMLAEQIEAGQGTPAQP